MHDLIFLSLDIEYSMHDLIFLSLDIEYSMHDLIFYDDYFAWAPSAIWVK